MMHGLFLLCLFSCSLAFTSTWQTTSASETVVFPTLYSISPLTVNWGDGVTVSTTAASYRNLTHTYAAAGAHVVTINGTFLWIDHMQVTKTNLIDISSWAGLTMSQNSTYIFAYYANLQVSCPASTQPTFPVGTTLEGMFFGTSFNAPLNWDLMNVVSVAKMFYGVPVNQSIQFRNTQGVTSAFAMFAYAESFNQPFSFDCSGVTDMKAMFLSAKRLNSPLTLTNTGRVTSMQSMFEFASGFNQPLTLNTSSVTNMDQMFHYAIQFNSTLTFSSTAKVTSMAQMFDIDSYEYATPGFEWDVSSWDVSKVTNCTRFCRVCGMPSFNLCSPCSPLLTTTSNWTVCRTRGPTSSPTSRSPTSFPTTHSPSRTPTQAPSDTPTNAPSTHVPTASPSRVPTDFPTFSPSPIPKEVSSSCSIAPLALLAAALTLTL